MARSRSIGGIYASLSLRDGGFKAGLRSARKSLDSFADGVAGFAKGAALAAPAAAFAAVALSMKSAIDAGGELNDMMGRTGAAGEGLFVMQRAFENAGLSAAQVPAALNKMQKALTGVNDAGELTNGAFDKLGLSAASLMAQDPVAAFKSIQTAISGIADPAKRTAVAMELFGKSGGEMLAVLTDSSAFSQAEQQVGSLGKTLADNAAKLDAVGDALGAIGTKFQVIGAEMAVALLPQMESLAEKMNEADFQHFGQGMGNVVTKTLEWAEALGKVAKYTPAGFLIGAGAESLFGGEADMVKARKMAAEMTKYNSDFVPESTAPYYTEGLAVPDESESIRWFKNGGFAEAMRGVNGFPEPSYGVPPMLAEVEAIKMIPDLLKRVDAAEAPQIGPRQVNSYQAKGWSLDGNNSGRAIETTNTLLGKIKDILSTAKKNGRLEF